MLGYDHSDATLVMLTLAGDQRAYEALVTRYERAVMIAATSVAGNSFMAGCLCQRVDEAEYPGRSRKVCTLGLSHRKELRQKRSYALPQLHAHRGAFKPQSRGACGR